MSDAAFSSFDQGWAAVTFPSDQCDSFEVDIDDTVRVVKLGPTNTLAEGLREEYWQAWIVAGGANPTAYLAFSFQAAATPVPAVGTLTLSGTMQRFCQRPATLEVGLRVPKDKPFMAYRWSFAGLSKLRLIRIRPDRTP